MHYKTQKHFCIFDPFSAFCKNVHNSFHFFGFVSYHEGIWQIYYWHNWFLSNLIKTRTLWPPSLSKCIKTMLCETFIYNNYNSYQRKETRTVTLICSTMHIKTLQKLEQKIKRVLLSHEYLDEGNKPYYHCHSISNVWHFWFFWKSKLRSWPLEQKYIPLSSGIADCNELSVLWNSLLNLLINHNHYNFFKCDWCKLLYFALTNLQDYNRTV